MRREYEEGDDDFRDASLIGGTRNLRNFTPVKSPEIRGILSVAEESLDREINSYDRTRGSWQVSRKDDRTRIP